MIEYANKPICFWAWNYSMDKNEMIAQLNDFLAKGIGGVFVHARAGLKIEYLGDEWFSAFQVVVETCEKIGLEVWIYDEDGWPSGFAGGKVYSKSDEYLETYLLMKVGCPRDEKELDIVAIYDEYNSGYNLLWKQSDFCAMPDFNSKKIIIYKETNPVYVDILNPNVVDYFIKVTHEVYKEKFGNYFGNVIKGIFTDEPHFSPNGIPWGHFVAQDFEKLNKYSPYNILPYLFEKNGNYQEARYDYWKNISDMMVNYYARPYNEWCKKNNLIFTGHYACEEGLVDQIAVSGGVMPLYSHMGMPGVDSLGNRLVPPAVFKQVEAVAWQTGNRKVLCETYACSGYDTTFADMLWIWSWQASMGVNVPCLSISMFSLLGTRKRDYPTFFSYQMPWWSQFKTVSRKLDLINDSLISGERKNCILVIHPKTSVWCERGYGQNLEEKKISSAFRSLTESLINLQVDFDYGDEQILADVAKVENGKVVVGNMQYNSIIIPPMLNIEKSTVKLIEEFHECGGSVVIVDSYPTLLSGKHAAAPIFKNNFVEITNRTDAIRKYFLVAGFKRDIEIVDEDTNRTMLGLSTAYRQMNDSELFFYVNVSKSQELKGVLKAKGNKKLVVNYLNDSSVVLESFYNEKEDITFAKICIQPQEAALIKIENKSLKPFTKGQICDTIYMNEAVIETTENVLVVDKVEVSVNDKLIAKDFAIKTTPLIYKLIDGKEGENIIKMEYSFCVSNLNITKNIFLTAESLDADVFINGIKVEKIGYWLDKEFSKFNITNIIKNGENTVTIIKKIKEYKSQYNLDKVFQSVTNIFSYDYDVENIYIIGDFDVVAYDKMYSSENCNWASEKGFYITNKTNKNNTRDLTLQNMPFFVGEIKLTTKYNIDVKGNNNYILQYDKPNFPTAMLSINGKYVSNLGIPPYCIDITDFLSKGENILEINIISNARNVLGPHHHVKGKHPYVGHTVFKGYVEFEDPVVFPELIGKKTWTNNYAVVPFGLNGLRIQKSNVNE